jgi:putative transposase
MDASCPTDLTDEQWQAVSRLVTPAKPGGRPREVDMRQVLNALFCIGRTGCALLQHAHPCRSDL